MVKGKTKLKLEQNFHKIKIKMEIKPYANITVARSLSGSQVTS